MKPQKAEENIFHNFSSFVVDRGAQVWENLCCQLISWLESEMSFLKFFVCFFSSPYFFNTTLILLLLWLLWSFTKQYVLSVHLMFQLCLFQVFSSFEFKIARAKILLETFSELYANKGDFILELFFGFQGCCFGFYPSSMYFVVKHVNTRLPNLWRLFFKRSIYQASVIISDKRGTWLKQHFCSFWYRKNCLQDPCEYPVKIKMFSLSNIPKIMFSLL